MRITARDIEMVRGTARNLSRTCFATPEYPELVGAGLLGLAEAVNSWRSDGGASFRTVAGSRIRGRIMDHLRRGRRWHRREPRLGTSYGEDAVWPAEHLRWMFGHCPGIPENNALKNDRRRQLREAMNALPEEERRVLELLFFKDMKSKEVADLLGLARRTITALRRRALNRLQARLPITAPELCAA